MLLILIFSLMVSNLLPITAKVSILLSITAKMRPVTEDISVLIIWLAWYCLSTTYSTKKNMEFDLVFPSEPEHDGNLSVQFRSWPFTDSSISDTSYHSLLQNASLHLFKLWAVYLLVLEKDRESSRIYVGSGTGLALGVRSRMTAYDRRSRTGKPTSYIPSNVESSLQEEWKNCVARSS